MKGIILAGGSGTRLYPLTLVTSKQLLPVYDKPMIYYPLSTLMLAGVSQILIISTPKDLPKFEQLLGDGRQFGIQLTYQEQPAPEGLAQALVLGETFLGGDPCVLILGDNIFYGNGFRKALQQSKENVYRGKATIFGYAVNDPKRFGVVEFDPEGKAISIEEKPEYPKSKYCITGLYFFDQRAVGFAKKLTPSKRGEFEITDVIRRYLEADALRVQLLGRGYAWLDTGTVDSLIDAATFVQMVEERQGIKISAPEEIAYINRWIDKEALLISAKRYGSSPYGEHLRSVAEGSIRY